MNSVKSGEASIGIKIRRWQGGQTYESLPNGNHGRCFTDNSSISPIHNVNMEKREDTASTEMQSLAENVVKGTHSLDTQSKVHHSANEHSKDQLQVDKISCMGEYSLKLEVM